MVLALNRFEREAVRVRTQWNAFLVSILGRFQLLPTSMPNLWPISNVCSPGYFFYFPFARSPWHPTSDVIPGTWPANRCNELLSICWSTWVSLWDYLPYTTGVLKNIRGDVAWHSRCSSTYRPWERHHTLCLQKTHKVSRHPSLHQINKTSCFCIFPEMPGMDKGLLSW